MQERGQATRGPDVRMRGRRGFAAQSSCHLRDGELSEKDGGTCWSAQSSRCSTDLVNLHFEVVGEGAGDGAEAADEGLGEGASEGGGVLMSRRT